LRQKAKKSKEAREQFFLGALDENPTFVLSVTWKKLKSTAGTTKED
jgi:hypothetical protein